jgi:Fe-S cluster biogenesis protein NfuA
MSQRAKRGKYILQQPSKYGKMRDRVEKALEKIRPSLQADGGGVELVGVTGDGVVKVKLTGACAGCPMATMTLAMGIERAVKQEVPEVKRVEAV